MKQILLSVFSLLSAMSIAQTYQNYSTSSGEGYRYEFTNESGKNYCDDTTIANIFPSSKITISHGGTADGIVVAFDNHSSTENFTSYFSTNCADVDTVDLTKTANRIIKMRVKPSIDVAVGIIAGVDYNGDYTVADRNFDFKDIKAGVYTDVEFAVADQDWRQNSLDLSKVVGWSLYARKYNKHFSPSAPVTLEIDAVYIGDVQPVVDIPDQTLKQGFISYDIDLKNHFNVFGPNSTFSVSGNTNISVVINNDGIATISANAAWFGTENITFELDNDGVKTSQQVNFTVQELTGSTENQATATNKGYNFEYKYNGVENFCNDLTNVLPHSGISVQGGGSNSDVLKVLFDGTQGTSFFKSMLSNPLCEADTINMSTDMYRKISIRLKSSTPVNVGVALLVNSANGITSIAPQDYESVSILNTTLEFNISRSINLDRVVGYAIALRKHNEHWSNQTSPATLTIDWVKLGDANTVVNTPPKLSSILEYKLKKGFSSFDFDLATRVSDKETSDAKLIYEVTAGSTDLSASLSGSVLTLSSSDPNFTGTDDITVKVTDEGGLSVTGTITFNVIDEGESSTGKGYLYDFAFDGSKNTCTDVFNALATSTLSVTSPNSIYQDKIDVVFNRAKKGDVFVNLFSSESCPNTTTIDLSSPDHRKIIVDLAVRTKSVNIAFFAVVETNGNIEYVKSTDDSEAFKEARLQFPSSIERFEYDIPASTSLSSVIGWGMEVRDINDVSQTDDGWNTITIDHLAFGDIAKVLSSEDSFEESSEVIAYPNPASNYVHFNNKEDISNVELMSLTGSVVSTFNVSEGKVDVSNVVPGTYLLKVTYNDTVKIEKIIVE